MLLTAGHPTGEDRPVGAAEFAALIGALGPFEPAPKLAVAVSGGADSMALALLTHAWAAERGGCVVALTVDHGLRPASADEAETAGRRLAARGIPQQVLRWDRAAGTASGHAAARDARYRLLDDAARRHGALHLLAAHTLEDQAETVLQRLARGSGPAGLAAMPPVRDLPGCRLLRPLLGIAKARLRATCRASGLAWVEDPSNADPRFDRARLRRAAPMLAAAGLTAPALAASAQAAALWRNEAEGEAGRLLGRAAAFHPEGYATLDPAALLAAPPGIAGLALAACLRAVGGGRLLPDRAAVARILVWLGEGGGGRRSAGRCVIVRGRRLAVLREGRAVPTSPLPPGPEPILWDGRFRVRRQPGAEEGRPLEIAALGPHARGLFARGAAPWAALSLLPGGYAGGRLVAAPRIAGCGSRAGLAQPAGLIVDFRPRVAAAGPAFTVVWHGPGII